MKHLLIAFALTTLAATRVSAQTESAPGADVESLLAIARERNPELASVVREAQAAAERAEFAGALPDPRLRTELMDVTKGGTQDPSLLPSRTGSARYTLIQEIPWYGKRDLRRGIAESEALGVNLRRSATWSEIAARIKIAYSQLFFLTSSQALLRETLDLSTRLEQVAQARYSAGLAAQQDVIRAQVEKTAARAELIALESQLRQQRAKMNALLGRPANAELAAPQKLRPLPASERLDMEALAVRARQISPSIQAEEARLQLSEKSRDLVFKNRYPDLTVGIAPNQTQNSFNQWDLMVEISIPLQQSTRRSQERESEALVEAARSRRESASNQVLSELSESMWALLAARQTESLTTDVLLVQAELTFKSALVGYENGNIDFATLLDAQRQIRQARQTQIKAQAEAQERLANIERLIGEDL
jgi:cobalt-zinc-cadmium efflux system outer membrane protein